MDQYILILMVVILIIEIYNAVTTYKLHNDVKRDECVEVLVMDGYPNSTYDAEDNDTDDEAEDDGRFLFIDREDSPYNNWIYFDIIVDKETGVQYLQDEEGFSLTPLIDKDGKPILYNEEFYK